MPFECMSWVIGNSRATGSDYRVLLMIAWHANDQGGGTWPSLETLAREARLSRRAVCYSIDALTQLGELEITQGGGRGRSNNYRVLMGNSATLAPFPETVQTETVQTTTGNSANCAETVQTTTGNSATVAPEPHEPHIEPHMNPKQHAICAPAELKEFDRILRSSRRGGYQPTSDFLNKILDKYGALDLEEEAIKLTGWLDGKPGRKLTTAFVLNWLKRATQQEPEIQQGGSHAPHRLYDPPRSEVPEWTLPASGKTTTSP